MKKNKMMRLASCLMVLVMLTTCMISGTFAKYVTSVESQDSARVAYWGFEPVAMDITDLFYDVYGTTVDSNNGNDVIAPGTFGSSTFAFAYDNTNGTAPEVAYNFKIVVDATCDDAIKNNENIVWSLDGVACASWDDMVAKIKALAGDDSGSKDYAPNEIPVAFADSTDIHTISWSWEYSTNTAADVEDTTMGNAADLADCSIKITITATQID